MEGAIPNLTADQLDAELKLSERGAADGRKNIPVGDEGRLSAVEAMVVSRIEGAISQKSNEILGVGSGQDFTTLPQDLEVARRRAADHPHQFPRQESARAEPRSALSSTPRRPISRAPIAIIAPSAFSTS